MLEVDKKTFEDEVLKAEGYVFVDFFGDGCVPCQALMPFVHEMADKYQIHISEYNKSSSSCYRTEDPWSSGYGYLQRWRKSRRSSKR